MQGVGRSSLKMSFSSRRARRFSRSAKRFVVPAEACVTPATIAVEGETKFRRDRKPVCDIGSPIRSSYLEPAGSGSVSEMQVRRPSAATNFQQHGLWLAWDRH